MDVGAAHRLELSLRGAATLLRTDRWFAARHADDAQALGLRLSDASSRAEDLLDAAAESLDRLADDLRWRVAWVGAHGGDGIDVRVPDRGDFEGLRLHALVVRLENASDDSRRGLLDEIALRLLADPSGAATLIANLDPEEIREITHRVDTSIYREFGDAGREDWYGEGPDPWASIIDGGGEGMAAAESWGIVLGAMSSLPAGRELLLDAFDVHESSTTRRIDAVSALILPMLHGDWHGGFVAEVLDSVLDDRFVLDSLGSSAHWRSTNGIDGFEPRLMDPLSVMVDALGRDPRAAREWLLADGSLDRLLAVDPHPAHALGVYVPLDTGGQLDDALADLLRTALLEPLASDRVAEPGRTPVEWHRERIWWLLAGDSELSTLDERPDGGLFAVVGDRGLPGSSSATALADLVNVVWDRLAPSRNGDALTTNHVEAGMAELVRHDEALARLGFGYGLYLEHTFTEALGSGDSRAIEDAIDAADMGFQMLDAGLDRVRPDDDSRALFRRGLDAALSHGAKQLFTRLGAGGGWAGAAAGFAAGTVIDEVLGAVLPAPIDDRVSSQSLLEELFIPATGAHRREPAPVNIALANAAIANDPALAERLEPSGFVRDGVIVVPAEDRDAFSEWFHDVFEDDAVLEEAVFDLAEDLSVRVNRHT
ncbi:MAG: hypothetical protein AAF548_00455 [Actinomycetota bacterium]